MENRHDPAQVRVAILGATGYTALELVKILLRHPCAEIVALTSRQEGEQAISTVHPQLAGRLELPLQNLSPEEVASRADCVFSCLPHTASARACSVLLEAGARVIDFSADYRLRSASLFEQWYKVAHVDAARLESAVYGLPEWFASEIRTAQLVANPGCYPTSAILPLAPLLAAGLIAPTDIVIDSKSGVSGAGRTPGMTTHYPECNESIAAYAVGEHRHSPEIEQYLTELGGQPVEILFTPHLTPMDRGILTTAYAKATRAVTINSLLALLRERYADCPFIRIVERLPTTKDVAHTNFCDITARVVGGRIVTISCEDNLIKGASGQAVQNFNLMYGFDERTGLCP